MLMLGLYSGIPSSGGALIVDASPFVRSCTITTNEHGFENLSATIDRALADAFRLYDYPLLYVGLFAGSQIVWEGRLEDPTLFANPGGSGLTIAALGAWRALSDLPDTAFWSTTSVADFRPLTLDDRATSRPEKFSFDNNNRLFVALNKNETYGAGTTNGRTGMQIPDDSSRSFVGVQFAFDMNLPATYTARLLSFSGGYSGTVTVEWSKAGAGVQATGALHLLITSADAIAFEITTPALNYAGETGDSYLKIAGFRAVSRTNNRVNTTLTANRNAGANVTATVGSTAGMYVGQQLVINSGAANSEIVTVLSIGSSTQFNATFVQNYVIGNAVQAHVIYADEVALHAVANIISATNPAQFSNATALITSPGLDLLNLIYEDVSLGDVLTRLAALGDSSNRRYEVGVYEDRKLFFRAQLSADRTWYVDATDLQVVRSLEQFADSVYSVYSDANGRALRSTPTADSASLNRYGLTRRAATKADTTNTALANTIAATALADSKDPKPRATIQFDAVYDSSGARYPLWLVRAGDTMTIRNLPVGISTSVDRIRTFRITHTSYDAIADTLDVEPETPPRILEVMLARRAEGITA